MKTIEYKTLVVKFKGAFPPTLKVEEVEKSLNGMGEQGWEMVSSIPKQIGASPIEHVLIFKREK